MSGLTTATPAPSTELPTIYRSGDLVLQNPQETCMIFVAVILVSALLEYSLQRISNIDNKYARSLVNTMSQEVTIIGVLALFLMFTVSVIPRRFITPLYVSLFSWANMSMFFMAAFFVLTVIFQFAVAFVDKRLWKTFEEGKLDAEELSALSYRERIFRLCYDHYRVRLEKRAGLQPSALPFHEYIATTLRRQLVRVSNLSYRTWLSLSVAVLANLLRAMLTPFEGRSESDEFWNALMFILVVGWGSLLVFLAFFGFQQFRLVRYARGDLTPTDNNAATLVPFGTAKRGLEFLQVVIMTFNWYVTLFITGNAKQMTGARAAWRLGTLFTLFAVPLIAFWVLLPWAFFCIALVTTIGDMKPRDAVRLSKVLKGEVEDSDSDSDESDEGDDAPVAMSAKKSSDRGSRVSKGVRSQSVASSEGSGLNVRPAWLEEDDEWDGHRTVVPGSRPTHAVEMDRAFYSSVNTTRVRRMLSRSADPRVASVVRPPDEDAAPDAVVDEDDRPRYPGRPSWWEPGDPVPTAAGASTARSDAPPTR